MTGSDWIKRLSREEVRQVYQYLQRTSGGRHSQDEQVSVDIEASTCQTPNGQTYNAIIVGNPNGIDAGIQVASDTYYIHAVTRRKVFYDNRPADVYVIETDGSGLYVRRFDTNTRYEIQGLTGMYLWGGDTTFPHNKPSFSPTGRHILVPYETPDVEPYGELKFRILKDWKLKTDPTNFVDSTATEHTLDLNNFLTSLAKESVTEPVEIPNSGVVSDYKHRISSNIALPPVPLNTCTHYYTEVSGGALSDGYPADTTIYNIGPFNELGDTDHKTPTLSLSLMTGSARRAVYWFTEDASGDPVVDFYSLYVARGLKHKIYSLSLAQSSSHPLNGDVGMMPSFIYADPLVASTMASYFVDTTTGTTGTGDIPLFRQCHDVPPSDSYEYVDLCGIEFAGGGVERFFSGTTRQFIATGGVDPLLGSTTDFEARGVIYCRQMAGADIIYNIPVVLYDWSKYRKAIIYMRLSNAPSNVPIPADSMQLVVNPSGMSGTYGLFGTRSVAGPQSSYPIKHGLILPGSFVPMGPYEVDFGGAGPSAVSAIGILAAYTPLSPTSLAVLTTVIDPTLVLTNIQDIPTYGSSSHDPDTGITLRSFSIPGYSGAHEPVLLDGIDPPDWNSGEPSPTGTKYYNMYGGQPVPCQGLLYPNPNQSGLGASPVGSTKLAYTVVTRSSAITRGLCRIANVHAGGSATSVNLGHAVLGCEIGPGIFTMTGLLPPNTTTHTSFIARNTEDEGIKNGNLIDGYTSTTLAGSGTASVLAERDYDGNFIDLELRTPAIQTSSTTPVSNDQGISRTHTDFQDYDLPGYSVRQYNKYLWEAYRDDDGNGNAEARRVEWDPDTSTYKEKTVKGKPPEAGYTVVDWVFKTRKDI